MKKKLKQFNKKLIQSIKTLKLFYQQTLKNYQSMKKKLVKIWAIAMLFAILPTTSACNVTRTISTESKYYQKGDTTCTIVTKTIESYDSQKK